MPVGKPARRFTDAALTIAFLTAAGDAVRLYWRNRAATPVTCGVAIDVPLRVLIAVLLVDHADVMPDPGALRLLPSCEAAVEIPVGPAGSQTW